ncbi:hypothetical protein [Natrinema sp. 74]
MAFEQPLERIAPSVSEEAQTEAFEAYAERIVANAKHRCEEFPIYE